MKTMRLITNLSKIAVAILLTKSVITTAQAAQKVQGFRIETCRPLDDKTITMDFCSQQAISLYKKQLTKPINFNGQYVLFPIDLPKPLKDWGKVTNYAALNPKTKQVIPVPFGFITDTGYARLSFNQHSNKVCTIDRKTNLMGDGIHAGTYTPSSDGNVNYCFNLYDNQQFSTALDFIY